MNSTRDDSNRTNQGFLSAIVALTDTIKNLQESVSSLQNSNEKLVTANQILANQVETLSRKIEALESQPQEQTLPIASEQALIIAEAIDNQTNLNTIRERLEKTSSPRNIEEIIMRAQEFSQHLDWENEHPAEAKNGLIPRCLFTVLFPKGQPDEYSRQPREFKLASKDITRLVKACASNRSALNFLVNESGLRFYRKDSYLNILISLLEYADDIQLAVYVSNIFQPDFWSTSPTFSEAYNIITILGGANYHPVIASHKKILFNLATTQLAQALFTREQRCANAFLACCRYGQLKFKDNILTLAGKSISKLLSNLINNKYDNDNYYNTLIEGINIIYKQQSTVADIITEEIPLLNQPMFCILLANKLEGFGKEKILRSVRNKFCDKTLDENDFIQICANICNTEILSSIILKEPTTLESRQSIIRSFVKQGRETLKTLCKENLNIYELCIYLSESSNNKSNPISSDIFGDCNTLTINKVINKYKALCTSTNSLMQQLKSITTIPNEEEIEHQLQAQSSANWISNSFFKNKNREETLPLNLKRICQALSGKSPSEQQNILQTEFFTIFSQDTTVDNNLELVVYIVRFGQIALAQQLDNEVKVAQQELTSHACINISKTPSAPSAHLVQSEEEPYDADETPSARPMPPFKKEVS